MTTPTIRYKDMTADQLRQYFRDKCKAWYQRNALTISRKNAARYRNDPEYRERVKAASAARRQRLKQAQAVQ